MSRNALTEQLGVPWATRARGMVYAVATGWRPRHPTANALHSVAASYLVWDPCVGVRKCGSAKRQL